MVGIHGAWGEGKTTVLNFMDRALSAHPSGDRTVVLRFNPWRYEDEDSLLANFFGLLAQAISVEIRSKGERVADLIRSYGTSAAAVVGKGENAAAAADLLDRRSLEEVRSRVDGALEVAEGLRVAVLVDDIDRLRRRDIQALFRLVALTADFPRVVYVLAFDPKIVADALSEVYGYQDADAGSRFLEKVVQVPLPLPAIDQAQLVAICTDGIRSALVAAGVAMTDDEERQLAKDFQEGVRPLLETPRMAKRPGRVIEFLLPLVQHEVNVFDFVLLECLHVLCPAVYDGLLAEPGYFVRGVGEWVFDRKEHQTRGATYFGELLEPYSPRVQGGIKALLARLFPDAAGLEVPRFTVAEDAATRLKNQRACSPEYFSRYVTYAVRPGDVSDAALSAFLSTLGEGGPLLADRLRELVETATPTAVLDKLRARAGILARRESQSLLHAIALVFPSLDVPWPVMAIRPPPRVGAAHLMLDLIENFEEGARGTVLLRALEACSEVSLLHEVLRIARAALGRGGDGPLPDDGVEALEQMVLSRTRAIADRDPYFLASERLGARLLADWARHAPSEVEVYLEAAFQDEPQRLGHFLGCFMSRTAKDASAEPVLQNLTESGFEAIRSMYPLSDLSERIADYFDLDPAIAQWEEDFSIPAEVRAARQFLAMARRLLTSGDGPPAS